MATLAEIDVARILANPDQPRAPIDEASLVELAASINEHGVILPVAVEDSGNGWYTLHDGERRWRAAVLAGLATIPALVSPASEDRQGRRLARALAANIQRTDLNDIEEARAYQALKDLGQSDAAIARAVSKSRAYVTNKRRLLELPDDIQGQVQAGMLTERQAMALLPLAQLPPALIEEANRGYGWATPAKTLREAATLSSDAIRQRVQAIVEQQTIAMGKIPFADHPFDLAGELQAARSARCNACPARLKVDGEWRCQHTDCHAAKLAAWRELRLAAASAATGYPALEAGADYSTAEHFWGEGQHLAGILAKGCPNLRVQFNPNAGAGDALIADFPDVTVVCYHGKGKPCKCLSRAKGEATRTDPLRIAERERKQRLEAEVIGPAVQAVAAAIAAGHLGAWRRLMAAVDYELRAKDDWDLARMQAGIARRLVENRITWQGRNDVDQARHDMQVLFDEMGLELPGEPGDGQGRGLFHKWARIRTWSGRLHAELPTLEAVRGNLANVEKLLEAFDAGQGLAGASAEEIEALGRDLANARARLADLVEILGDVDWPADELDEAAAFTHVSWLVTVPAGDTNFEGHLKAAPAIMLRYALAILPEVGNQTKRKAIERRLRALGWDTVSAQTEGGQTEEAA